MMVVNKSLGERVFDVANHVFLALVGLLTLAPFLYVVFGSFTDLQGLTWHKFTVDAYRYIFSTDTFVRSIGVSVYITVVGTAMSLVATALSAYALAHKPLPGRRFLLLMVLFTMLFSGGMIPTYFVVKSVGLINT
ncbi:hypothetical protein GCM10010885_22050 [Alicyclobacillus cellulosilyticus]|uniref:ABC transmembrane type-1 domain-containing protein n=1 Tax=Alicyclobacillus cellulosilyticus TaxID=1003997 RepID=A0A917NML5_9BACL|nr:carbohydrate ABC transporter permease [Alicyclobacillus cellulosilyticus]GGJ12259.1 hypothetical protein GCM10010885_22050 [Alicyclobacillus cellulosilyticus]